MQAEGRFSHTAKLYESNFGKAPEAFDAVDVVRSDGEFIGRMIVAKYFPPKAKNEIQTLVKNIVAAFGKRIDGLTWMSPETKAKAKAKLTTLYVGVGYPDHWQSYAGHEISHSFDDTGSQFDAEGRLLNWWTSQDYGHFKASSDKLAAQYDTYEPLPGLHLNGKQTLGENIADVAGLSAAYDAYRAAYGGKEAPSANGLSGDQRFFVAFGQSWRGKMRPETLRIIVMTDGHSPDQYRADTVRNIDAWYEAFNVKPGNKLYLAPNARVKIW